MDKRKEANLQVKQRITQALFALMEDKPLSGITVTELVQEAGVARASFYRNYSAKEDVITTLIRDVLDAFRAQIDWSRGTFYIYENVLLSFRYFYYFRSYAMELYRAGYSTMLLDELNHFHESVEGTMPSSSIEKYQLYLYIGALFNAAMIWLPESDRISPEEMARFFCRHFPEQ
jgi:AcrR family transcriptional regulator